MDRIVIDSSVVIKWFFDEPYCAEARRILQAFRKGTVTLLAPDLIYAELGNVVWKKHRFQGVAAADAQQVVEELQQLPLIVTSSADLLADAYRLAVAQQRTVYDALYLALSLREHAPFVSADQKLVNAVGTAIPGVIWVANWS